MKLMLVRRTGSRMNWTADLFRDKSCLSHSKHQRTCRLCYELSLCCLLVTNGSRYLLLWIRTCIQWLTYSWPDILWSYLCVYVSVWYFSRQIATIVLAEWLKFLQISLNTLFCLCYTASRRPEERHCEFQPQLFNWQFFISPMYIAILFFWMRSLTVLGTYPLRFISQIRQLKACTGSLKEAQGMEAGTTLCNTLSSSAVCNTVSQRDHSS